MIKSVTGCKGNSLKTRGNRKAGNTKVNPAFKNIYVLKLNEAMLYKQFKLLNCSTSMALPASVILRFLPIL